MFKRGRFALLVPVAAVGLAIPATGTAASSPSASVSISSSADWLSPAQIVVYVTASCAPFFNGTAGFVSVNLNQATSASAPGGFGSTFTNFTCDNQNHRFALNVSPGPWQLGTGQVSAVACGFACDTQIKQVRITRA